MAVSLLSTPAIGASLAPKPVNLDVLNRTSSKKSDDLARHVLKPTEVAPLESKPGTPASAPSVPQMAGAQPGQDSPAEPPKSGYMAFLNSMTPGEGKMDGKDGIWKYRYTDANGNSKWGSRQDIEQMAITRWRSLSPQQQEGWSSRAAGTAFLTPSERAQNEAYKQGRNGMGRSTAALDVPQQPQPAAAPLATVPEKAGGFTTPSPVNKTPGASTGIKVGGVPQVYGEGGKIVAGQTAATGSDDLASMRKPGALSAPGPLNAGHAEAFKKLTALDPAKKLAELNQPFKADPAKLAEAGAKYRAGRDAYFDDVIKPTLPSVQSSTNWNEINQQNMQANRSRLDHETAMGTKQTAPLADRFRQTNLGQPGAKPEYVAGPAAPAQDPNQRNLFKAQPGLPTVMQEPPAKAPLKPDPNNRNLNRMNGQAPSSANRLAQL